MDPPQQDQQQHPAKSLREQLRSGLIRKRIVMVNEEEDDFPEDYIKDKLDIWVILEWVSLILITVALVCSFVIPSLRKRRLWDLSLWKWEVLILVLICGRLVSSWVVRIVVFFIERNFLLRKRVLYFVYGIKKPVQNCLWLGLVVIPWHFLFDEKVERETKSKTLGYVTEILVCLVVGTSLWLVKTLVVKVLASSFHASTYFERIHKSLFNQYVIRTLSGPPLSKTKRKQGVKVIGRGRMQKNSRINIITVPANDEEGGIRIYHLLKLNPKNVSAWNMKRLMDKIALSTLDEQIQDSTHDDDESATKIHSEFEAKAAATKIFQNVAKPLSRHIYPADIMRFMEKNEALKAMSLFEGASESKKISNSCLENWVVNAFRERRALAMTLNDSKTAINKLHHMVNVLVGILIAIIWLLILGIATSKFLVFLSSQLLLVAFIFGNTCKTVFEAIIFLFVIHPFDVGDRCEIDGVQMVVEEMNILTTFFRRYDNQKIIIPNSVLATKAISNYYRSPDMGDAVEFHIHISTSPETIAIMKQRINSYIENKKDHWYPSPMIIFKDVEDLNRVRISIWLTHTMNHQDMRERWSRRALLLEEMVKIFQELDIQYRLLPLDINVRALPHVSSYRVPPSDELSG